LAKLIDLAVEYSEYVSEARGSVVFETKEGVNNIAEQPVPGTKDVLREEREMGLVRQIKELQARLDRVDKQGSYINCDDSSSDSEDVRFSRGGARRDNDRRFPSRHPSGEGRYRSIPARAHLVIDIASAPPLIHATLVATGILVKTQETDIQYPETDPETGGVLTPGTGGTMVQEIVTSYVIGVPSLGI
jgi:hypothetical protein